MGASCGLCLSNIYSFGSECSYLFHLPQDIFRVIFQYLSIKDLMKGEKAFLNNQELLSLYRSSLAGFTLKEEINNEEEELLSWIIDRKLLVEKLNFCHWEDISMNLLNHIRSSLKSIYLLYIDPNSKYPASIIPPLGHFPSLTSVTISSSDYFTKDILLSFFSHNPQLESGTIEEMHHLSNEILPHLSNSCPKMKILALSENDWVDDETMSLLTQQRLFPNLKSLDLRCTRVTNQESLRQFILSHPLLCGLFWPDYIRYSEDFLLFYLRQVIFPSILNHNKNNDLESHSLAVNSLWSCFEGRMFIVKYDAVTSEIYSVDILSRLYYKGCPIQTLYKTTKIVSHLSKFRSMIDSILQSRYIPFILHHTSPNDSLPIDYFLDLLFNCGVFHDYFPLLVEKYRPHPSSLIKIFYLAVKDHFSFLTTEELQTIIPIVLIELHKDSALTCLDILFNLLQSRSSQLLIDPNHLLMLFKSIYFSEENVSRMIECLENFISVSENYQQLLIESNLLRQVLKKAGPQYLINFANHCLSSSSRYELLVDHLVDSGLFQKLLSDYFQMSFNIHIEAHFKRLIEFKNNKYSETVRKMKLPDGLRVKLFEREKSKKSTNKVKR